MFTKLFWKLEGFRTVGALEDVWAVMVIELVLGYEVLTLELLLANIASGFISDYKL